MLPLGLVGCGGKAKIIDIVGGESIKDRLKEMGFNRGTLVKVVKNESGPLIIALGESRMMLGRSMAQKVMVQEGGC